MSTSTTDQAPTVLAAPRLSSAPRSRLLILVSQPIQHFVPWYRRLAQLGRLDLTVAFESTPPATGAFDPAFGRSIDWELDLSALDHVFLDRKGDHWLSKLQILRERLETFRPSSVIVYGYRSPTLPIVFRWCTRHCASLFQISDGFDNPFNTSPYMRSVQSLSTSAIYRIFDGFLYVGDQNRSFYSRRGVPSERLHHLPFPIDLGVYGPSFRSRERLRFEFRSRYQIEPDEVVIASVGKLVDRKRPLDIVRAAHRLSGRSSLVVALAGSGPLESEIRDLGRRLSSDRLRILELGFTPPSDLPGLLAGADLYVQGSSHDPHPLAVSEAIFMGLPAIVSTGCGNYGATDDVRPSVNGFVYPMGDVSALAVSIRRLLDTDLRGSYGRRSHLIGATHQARSYHDLYRILPAAEALKLRLVGQAHR